MTTFDLAAVEARLAKITPDWSWHGNVLVENHEDHPDEILGASFTSFTERANPAKDFIAHAPSDLAAAIAVIKAKDVLIEELKAALLGVLPRVRRNSVLRELAYQRARGALAKGQK